MKYIKTLLFGITLIIGLSISQPASAQCSMCRAVAASGTGNDAAKAAKGLNAGILYLLLTPYLIGGVAFFIWRKNRKKTTQVA